MTVRWQADNESDLLVAAQCLQNGQLVAFPTETVYGLGANALDDHAAKAIYQAKGRPSDNPLIVHIYDQKQLDLLTSVIPPKAQSLMERFWPGPLTLILPKSSAVPLCVSGGLATVAVRMPNHPTALKLLALADLPIAAPSANTSGRPSPTSAEHVWHDLSGKIAGIIDGGETSIGLESTVVDMTAAVPVILRPGAITKEQLESVIGTVAFCSGDDNQPKAPGMKYKHYAPKAEVRIAGQNEYEAAQTITAALADDSVTIGLMISEETLSLLPLLPATVPVQIIGSRQKLNDIARHLFAALRYFDDTTAEVIYTEAFPNEGIGRAVANRLNKAAAQVSNSDNEVKKI